MSTTENSFSVSGGTIKMKMPETDPKNWYIVREDSLRPERDTFILERFKKDFPTIKVKDSDQMYRVISRSKMATEWLTFQNLEYVSVVKIPGYARDVISPSVMEKVNLELTSINAVNAKKAKLIKEAADIFKKSLDEIENDENNKLPKTLSAFSKVLALNSSDMPTSVQLAIDNYVESDSGKVTRKDYARECLANYKKMLLDLVAKKADIDIMGVVNNLREK